jgi:hypothetical protein
MISNRGAMPQSVLVAHERYRNEEWELFGRPGQTRTADLTLIRGAL